MEANVEWGPTVLYTQLPSPPGQARWGRFFVASRIPFDKIVSVVESVKGERFSDFQNCHGDWGLVLYLARLHSGLTLQQIGDRVGGLAYKTVFARIKYLKNKLGKMHHYKRFMTNARTNCRLSRRDPKARQEPWR